MKKAEGVPPPYLLYVRPFSPVRRAALGGCARVWRRRSRHRRWPVRRAAPALAAHTFPRSLFLRRSRARAGPRHELAGARERPALRRQSQRAGQFLTNPFALRPGDQSRALRSGQAYRHPVSAVRRRNSGRPPQGRGNTMQWPSSYRRKRRNLRACTKKCHRRRSKSCSIQLFSTRFLPFLPSVCLLPIGLQPGTETRSGRCHFVTLLGNVS